MALVGEVADTDLARPPSATSRTNASDRFQSRTATGAASRWQKMVGLRRELRRRSKARHSEPV